MLKDRTFKIDIIKVTSKIKRRERKCLKCLKMFDSQSNENRICSSCKKINEDCNPLSWQFEYVIPLIYLE